MNLYNCPICGLEYVDAEKEQLKQKKEPCSVRQSTESGYHDYYCMCYKSHFSIHDDIMGMEYGSGDKERLLDLAAERILHSNSCTERTIGCKLHFYYKEDDFQIPNTSAEFINLADALKHYPQTTVDVAHRTLMNFARKFPNYGDTVFLFPTYSRLSFEHSPHWGNTSGVMQLLVDFGYVRNANLPNSHVITAAGWQKIDELRKEQKIIQQGFIAMAFRDETKPIREAFRKAMRESGYAVAIIDEKEHNNQIVPEIFYEIERSKFVVVDVTYPNYGAYYEAGYAQALGKQVIICCRETEFHQKDTRPHFDISQRSMIVWKDEADLVQRLKRRIEATVQHR